MQQRTIELNSPPPQLKIPDLSTASLQSAAMDALRLQVVVLPLPEDLRPGALVRYAQHNGDQQYNVASGTLRGITNRTEAMRVPLTQMLLAAAASGTLAGAPPPFSIRNVHGIAYLFLPAGAYNISFKDGSYTQPGYHIAQDMRELQEALDTCQKYGLSISDEGQLLVPAGGVMCEMGTHRDGREGVAAKAIGCIGLPHGVFAGLMLDVALVGDAGERVGAMRCVIAKAAGQCLIVQMGCLAGDVPIAHLEVEGEGDKKYTLVAMDHGPVQGAYARGRAARSGVVGGGGGWARRRGSGRPQPLLTPHPPQPHYRHPLCRAQQCGRAGPAGANRVSGPCARGGHGALRGRAARGRGCGRKHIIRLERALHGLHGGRVPRGL